MRFLSDVKGLFTMGYWRIHLVLIIFSFSIFRSFDESFEPKPLETKKGPVMPSFYPTRRPPSYDAPPPRGADYAPPPRRSFSPTTRPVPAVEVTTTELTNELNEAEKIKSMLKSGAVGNDPSKIKEMLLKMKKAKTAGTVICMIFVLTT